jgi:glutaconate CoA-transferase subunit B
VDFITSPGYGDGDGWRERTGLRGGGPGALITTMGVFDFRHGEAVLRSFHPFSGIAEIEASTGWGLALADDLQPTPEPTSEELAIIRAYDPGGFWTGA